MTVFGVHNSACHRRDGLAMSATVLHADCLSWRHLTETTSGREDIFGQQFGGFLCMVAWTDLSGHIKTEHLARKMWPFLLTVAKKQGWGKSA